jgi:hypothetical protein
MTRPGERKPVDTSPTRGDAWALGLSAVSGPRNQLAPAQLGAADLTPTLGGDLLTLRRKASR